MESKFSESYDKVKTQIELIEKIGYEGYPYRLQKGIEQLMDLLGD